jgi:GntR family transcriptional regulator
MYRQIAEELREEIERGSLKAGQQLPTETELIERFSASRNTIREAVKQLQSRGLVDIRPGQGTFVTQRIEPTAVVLSGGGTADASELTAYAMRIKDQNRTPLLTTPQIEIDRASGDVAAQLGIAEGEPVISRHQRLSIEKTPWSMQTSFYPLDFVNRGALRLIEKTNIEEGTAAYLEQSLKIRQAGYRDVITVRKASWTETDFFDLPYDGQVAVVEIQRTALDEAGQPIRLTISAYPADRNKLIYQEGTADIATSSSQQRPQQNQAI